ncbi:MAG: tetratricopeptide repeat protein [Deltaproteobacteria bacterium]|nr:tetratricopeptide repeat protein [Deltaproteobacteria bacterium]
MLILVGGCGHCQGAPSEVARDHLFFCARYLEAGELEKAEMRCELALEHEPNLPEAFNLLGLIARHRGQDDAAARSYKQAIALRADFPEALSNYGELFMDRREYARACELFQEAIRIDPSFVVARANLGRCLYHEDERAQARKEFLKCLEQDPDQCACRLGLGVLAADARALDEAKEHFTRLTEICPNDATGHYNLCWTFLEKGKCVEAVVACGQALKLDPGHLEARQAIEKAHSCGGARGG